jgi:uncharacterized protein YndB with AHSA1/START domain
MVTLENAPARTAVSIVRTLQAPLAQVYSAFSERDPIRKWLADDAHLRAAVGGHILLTWQGGQHVSGSYSTLEKNAHVAFSWRGVSDDQDSSVDVQLSETADGTQVELSHSGFSGDAEAVERDWEKRLDVLQAMLENGEDTRITHRVIIGIFPADFNAEIAGRMGLPVTEGARVGNLVPGYSAAAAGLQNDDVIVAVNGQAVTDNAPIGVQVRDNKPGDVVDVTYYRGSEKHTVSVTLKGYPVPEAVDNFAALADRLEKTYAEQDDELSKLFAGYSEAEAAHKTAPAEWSANEVMAHLILSERWQHNSLGCLMENPEADGWSANHIARTTAVTAVYPTSADLLAELRRGHAETVALLRHIPDTVAQKAILWQMNFQIDGMVKHTGQHVDQIRAALKTGKS